MDSRKYTAAFNCHQSSSLLVQVCMPPNSQQLQLPENFATSGMNLAYIKIEVYMQYVNVKCFYNKSFAFKCEWISGSSFKLLWSITNLEIMSNIVFERIYIPFNCSEDLKIFNLTVWKPRTSFEYNGIRDMKN